MTRPPFQSPKEAKKNTMTPRTQKSHKGTGLLRALTISAGLQLTLTGCLAKPRILTSDGTHHGESVVVLTNGVTITAEDRSFQLQSGGSARVPAELEMRSCPVARKTGFSTSNIDAYDWASAEDLGFVRVRVSHPDSPTELYGLMGLCSIHREERILSRQYEVVVPADRLPKTPTEVTVVYEYSLEHEVSGRPRPGFMLFLSKEPFRGGRSLVRRSFTGLGVMGFDSDDFSKYLTQTLDLPAGGPVSTLELALSLTDIGRLGSCLGIHPSISSASIRSVSLYFGASAFPIGEASACSEVRDVRTGVQFEPLHGSIRIRIGAGLVRFPYEQYETQKIRTVMAPNIDLTWFPTR